MITRSLITLLFSTVLLVPVHAERLYKLVDENGNVTYQSAPPSDDGGTVERRDIYGGEGPGEDVIARERAAFDHPVTLYAVGKCKPCDKARTQLQKRKIPFTENDPGSSAEVYKKFKELVDSNVVPVIAVGENTVTVYTPKSLDTALDIAGYPAIEKNKEGEEQTDELLR